MNQLKITILNEVSSDRIPDIVFSHQMNLDDADYGQPSVINVSNTNLPIDIASMIGEDIDKVDTICLMSDDYMSLNVDNSIIKTKLIVLGDFIDIVNDIKIISCSAAVKAIIIPKAS